jgi:hypothetical protein
MNFLNIYIHEGTFFVCLVPIVHETKVIMTQGKLLKLKICILRKIRFMNSCTRAKVVNMKSM